MRPHVSDIVSMSVASVAEWLIGEERRHGRVKLLEARRVIAREAGIAPGTLENLGRGRLKYVDRVAGKLNALLVTKLEQQIAALEHELQIARALASPRPCDLARAEAALKEARSALGAD